MKTKNNLVTLATVVATVILSCGLLSAQSNTTTRPSSIRWMRPSVRTTGAPG